MSVNYKYDFEKALYRAFVRTRYKDGHMTQQFVDGPEYRFNAGENLYVFKTNSNIVVNKINNKPVGTTVVDTKTLRGLTYTLYNNDLCVIDGEQDSLFDPINDNRPFIGSSRYLYVATTAKIMGGILFHGYEYANEIVMFGDYSGLIDMHRMFDGCRRVTVIDFGTIDTSNVTDMSECFSSCKDITTLDLSSFNTSNVTDMHYMFAGCEELINLDISSFNTSNVVNMRDMFWRCIYMTALDLSNWNVSNVEYVNAMFHSMSNLVSLNLNNWTLDNLHTDQFLFGDSSEYFPDTLYSPLRVSNSCNVYFSSSEGFMYDSEGNEYDKLPGGNLTLTKEAPAPSLKSTWVFKQWSGLTPDYAYNIWTDGENAYYSKGTTHYRLNESTNTWEPITFEGLSNFYGSGVWEDGDHIYYSQWNDVSIQYEFNKNTKSWSPKTWYGLPTNFRAGYDYIWHDADGRTFYTRDGLHYLLDRTTSTWSPITFTGFSPAPGNVWDDGIKTYASRDTQQYVLNPSTNEWVTKVWSGRYPYFGKSVFKDNNGICYVDRGRGDVTIYLDTDEDTWKVAEWGTHASSAERTYIWHFKNNTYYTYASTNAMLA